jgi:hypothetical protein
VLQRRSFPVSGKALGIGAGALALLVILLVAASFFLRTATVTVTVKRQPVTAEVTYAVVAPGADAPEGGLFTLDAAPVTLELPYRETIPATGEVREPDQIAAGRIALRNPTDSPIEIAEGTTFAANDGVEYAFSAAVTVPAADGANGAGRAEADVRAVSGGENANRDVGMLSGQLENGVYFSNRNAAITGGTDRVTLIVAQEDIDRLVGNANDQLPKRLISAPLDDGRVVLPGSVQPGALDFTTDHQAGDPADTVTIEATMVVSAMAFNPADAVTRASVQLETQLAANTPEGFELEPSTITTADPVLVNDQGDTGLYDLTATANARAIVDDSQRQEIANAITGMSPDEAKSVVLGYPFVEAAEIDTSPGILFSDLPDNSGKIEIDTR